ncbi:ATP-binding protein [Nisaea acidiphila]|uniref:histidine kinase n=1 Tax=Nisaea acidiphila TaxID=1862145 RepID=A0A9J7ANH3_9PROT|nr:ATP-binding protein [Nisaea acidiphila]UUX48490.1 ATP-binding protein [Nisaea acidiphila]
MGANPPFPKRLKVKLLAIVGVTFLALIVPGIWLLLFTTSLADEELLASRIGNLTARTALAVERHAAYGNPFLARDLLSPLAADRAFLCAELSKGDAAPTAAIPSSQGCPKSLEGLEIRIPASKDARWTLRVMFTDKELKETRRFEYVIGVSAIAVAILAALIAVAFGFYFLVDRPLRRLLASIRESSHSGELQPVSWSSRDEMGLVVQAYNAMIERERQREQTLRSVNEELRRSEADLSDLNRDLEDRVRERTRELEIAKKAAEFANMSKTRFLRAMSHELRTPLNAIIGFSDIMAHGTLGKLENERYQEFSVDIRDSGRHLLKIINELLDIARIEAGQDSLEEEIISADALVTEAVRLVKPLADDRGIALSRSQIDPELVLDIDATKMKQVLLNLLGNAVKYTPSGGTVKAIVALRPRHGEARQGGIEFHISDTGNGIPQDQIPKALTAFERLDDEITAAQSGTGLGLPLAQMMVELHGGTLTLESEVGVGTTVSVWLPANRVGYLRSELDDLKIGHAG